MSTTGIQQCTAFQGSRCIFSGNLIEVATKAKEALDHGAGEPVLIFDDYTSEPVEVDFRGTIHDVLKRLEDTGEKHDAPSDADLCQTRGRGRPKLGVISREVTLLPRHWEWLNSQPGGASVALRKLVEEARRVNSDRDKIRHSKEVVYRFMSAMAGNLPGFEEALRALFAEDPQRFNNLIATWPVDIRKHVLKLSVSAFRVSGSSE